MMMIFRLTNSRLKCGSHAMRRLSTSIIPTPSYRNRGVDTVSNLVKVRRFSMQDEYGTMDCSGHAHKMLNFELEKGGVLPELELRYKTFGKINEAKDNVVVVCHALTGNASLNEWWGAMLGPGKSFDTDKYLVVCANVVGSCYGSTGPTSVNPETGKVYGNTFPDVTIRDTVSAHIEMVQKGLGAKSVHAVIGGSLGGMQTLEWALLGGAYVKKAIVIGCGAEHTSWQIGISEAQRQCIYADLKWNGGDVDMNDPPRRGLGVARQQAMLTYRTAKGYHNKFGRQTQKQPNGVETFSVKEYLEYQGKKFENRFDPVTYVKITEQMDTHDVGRGRGGAEMALSSIHAKVMVVGIDSDVLYPIHEQEYLQKHIPGAELRVIKSEEGHDGFLLEQDQLGKCINEFI